MQEDLQSAISYAGGKVFLALRKVDYVLLKFYLQRWYVVITLKDYFYNLFIL